MKITGSTKVLGVVGDPIHHSLSPHIHNQWIKAAGLNAVYVPLNLVSKNPIDDFKSLRNAGVFGLNITLPHKIAAHDVAANLTPEAKAVGALNTLSQTGDHAWTGHNTDVTGFATALKATGIESLQNQEVLLIGAGGAARAALVHLQREQAKITIANRTLENAQKLADELAPKAQVAKLEDLKDLSQQANLIVNSASLGHSGAELPELSQGNGQIFLDLSYGKAADEILAHALQNEWVGHDGLRMLVGQAAAAFQIWFDAEPDQDSAYKACRSELTSGK